jgi:hypothetical protein
MQHTREEELLQDVDKDYVYPGGPLWDGVNFVQDRPPMVTG